MKTQLLEDLRKAINEYDQELAIASARRWIEEKKDPLEALQVMTAAIRNIGDGFGRGEFWLPDLVGASKAMASALPVFQEALLKNGQRRETLGTVVIGTVKGDVHTIGKDLVAALLVASGFEVYDLGINVHAEGFVEAVQEHRADLLAMSALMTMTAPEQEIAIKLLKKAGGRGQVKVMVGGGAITQEFADRIGADGYDATAPGAMRLARRLVGR
jgi:methanogenic corrinoid protein MtbC1